MALLLAPALPAAMTSQPASSCVDKELGFGPGSLRKFGIPSGLETCTNVIPILSMADTAANFTMYQVCTWSMPALSMALASKGLPWQPPGGAEYVYEVCEQYCNSMASVETPCSGGRLRLEESPIKTLGFKQLLGDGEAKSCETCSRGGEVFGLNAPVCCDVAHYAPADYAIQKDFKRGVRNKHDCAQRCVETEGCTGIHTTGTPNYCALWFNDACSSLNSAGLMSNGYCHNWHRPLPASDLALQQHGEPSHDDPKHSKPKHGEPSHDDPEPVEPSHDDPKHGESKHGESKHGEPKHGEPITVHGDPVLKLDGKGKRFDLPVGGPMVLLKWKGAKGETFILKGTTFERNVTHNVWFDSLAMTCCAGRPLFNVSTSGETRVGTMAVAIDGTPTNVTDISSTMNVTSVKHPSTNFSLRQYGQKRVGDKHAQQLEVKSQDAHFTVYSSGAGKFESKGEQFHWRHLNMHFEKGFPEGATGIFADLVASRSTGTSIKGNTQPLHCHDGGCDAEEDGQTEQGDALPNPAEQGGGGGKRNAVSKSARRALQAAE